jgi:RluA family pseudouridine synthase
MPVFQNIAAYQFAPLTDLPALRQRLLDLCRFGDLRGTILLSPEGINLFVAGLPEKIELLLAELRALPGLANLEVKVSESAEQPFNRMLVRLKKEIIAFGVEGVEPGKHTSPKLPPRVLKQWLDEGRPLVLLDTRNDYEVKLGTFKNAVAAGIDHFRDFPKAVRQMPSELKEQPIVMFCTGGIRCEKAGPLMEMEGFKNIFQLEGGILKYFEECGGAHYEGECFVFDQRVGVDPNLHETKSGQCFACLAPLREAELADPRYVPGQSCPHCYRSEDERRAALLAERHEAIQRAVNPLPGSAPYDNFRPVNIPEKCDGLTLLEALCALFPHVPSEEWEAELAGGRVLNLWKEAADATRRVRNGERFLRKYPNLVEPDVDGGVRILHEDDALIVVNKPAPLPMHPAGRFNRNTLQSILHSVYRPEKPRPAHRLDANTTGVVVLTRTRRFASLLQPQFARGEVVKYYLVRVQGSPTEDVFECDVAISAAPGEIGSREVEPATGLPSRTEFRVRRRDQDGTTLLEARPLTGRTNQIRIHLWHLGLPVCGDPTYLPGQKLGETQTLRLSDPPLCLHASRIEFTHPLTGQRVEFAAPPPSWAS